MNFGSGILNIPFGKMRTKATAYVREWRKDSLGADVETFVYYRDVWCHLAYDDTNTTPVKHLTLAADKLANVRNAIVTLRYDDKLYSKDVRFTINQEHYQVIGVEDVDLRKRVLRLTCTNTTDVGWSTRPNE